MSEPIPYKPGMTLMPGQSTSISVPLPASAEWSIQAGGCFVQAPPPKKAPVQDIAETLGLCAGLRAERRSDQWRCANCSKMQPVNSWLVWVPDSVRCGDEEWAVVEECRRNAYNGHNSGWCLKCAPKASRKTIIAAMPPKEIVAVAESWTGKPRAGFWARFLVESEGRNENFRSASRDR